MIGVRVSSLSHVGRVGHLPHRALTARGFHLSKSLGNQSEIEGT
jgi:hypothetical protein